MRYIDCSVFYTLAFGLGFGVMAAVFMSLTNPPVGATQFTGYMSLRNLAISYSAYWQRLASVGWGYGTMLAIDGLVALLPIALIPFLRPSTLGNRKN